MKKFVLILFSIMAFNSLSTIEAKTPYQTQIVKTSITNPQSKAEQLRWYFRIHNGVKQKRLWSITYGYWKTPWTNC